MLKVNISDYSDWPMKYKIIMFIFIGAVYYLFIYFVFISAQYHRLYQLKNEYQVLVNNERHRAKQLKIFPQIKRELRRLRQFYRSKFTNKDLRRMSEMVLQLSKRYGVKVSAIQYGAEFNSAGMVFKPMSIELEGKLQPLISVIEVLSSQPHPEEMNSIELDCQKASCNAQVLINYLYGE